MARPLHIFSVLSMGSWIMTNYDIINAATPYEDTPAHLSLQDALRAADIGDDDAGFVCAVPAWWVDVAHEAVIADYEGTDTDAPPWWAREGVLSDVQYARREGDHMGEWTNYELMRAGAQ
jgi:hypothetical protein